MPVSLKAYLRGVDEIAASAPAYGLGHDGSDGLCDCIGLTIGALRRAGGVWTGVHGSNWAARNALVRLSPLTDASLLTPGDCVLKARLPGEAGYSLPSRYAGDHDRHDYYHWGVVRSTSPLRIIHCTGPGVVTDTRLGRWGYYGWLKQLSPNEGDDEPMTATLTVSASSGSTSTCAKPREGRCWSVSPLASASPPCRNRTAGQRSPTAAGQAGCKAGSFMQMPPAMAAPPCRPVWKRWKHA